MQANDHWLTATLRSTRDLTPAIREFTLAPEGGATPYPTGAHLRVALELGGRREMRHYSLVGAAPREGCWRIAVKREDTGRGGSRAMWSMAPGARLTVAAPRSHFELSHGAPDYLLIAGGIGITPLLGMATVLRRRRAAFRLLYAGRSRGEMAFLPELADELGPALVVHADDEHGRLDLPARLAALHPAAEAYVCGPIGLLHAARRAWEATGRAPARLVFETFGSSGTRPDAAFTVRVPRLGREVVVPVGVSLLDALDAAGVAVMADCRRGECGLCAIDVLGAEGELDHRDVFLSDRQRAEGRKICACVSRAAGGCLTVDPPWRGDAPLTPGAEGRHAPALS